MAIEEEGAILDEKSLIFNLLMAFLCVTLAAVAAGLTMGLISIEPLSLMIKLRGGSEREKQLAARIFPVVKQHHLLLVTLLLLNSLANEALPLFLDELVPSYVAVLLSVTLVLFFGEIIPSAIFTGPNQLEIAYHMVPFVQFVMFLLTPISKPIAWLLDHYLGHDDELIQQYSRMELAAIVRIMYEEEMRQSRAMTKTRRFPSARTTSLLHPTHHPSLRSSIQRQSSIKSNVSNNHDNKTTTSSMLVGDNIHIDEVTMVEGALSMKIKTAKDAYKKLRNVFALSMDAKLDADTLATIYQSGHSRIPVYVPNFEDDTDISRILGLVKAKQLIVVDSSEERVVSSLPLQKPWCVSPDKHMVDLLNIFQKGRSGNTGGHLALVCEDPVLATRSLLQNDHIPSEAGVMGIITLEDVIECLLQENIYDEFDSKEKKSLERAKRAITKWKEFVKKKREYRQRVRTHNNNEDIPEYHSTETTITDMADAVIQVMDQVYESSDDDLFKVPSVQLFQQKMSAVVDEKSPLIPKSVDGIV